MALDETVSHAHTPEGWLLEIRLAIKDAREIEQFSPLTGQPLTNVNLFHLAPLVCLKFRGRKLVGREADRVTETALANYVVNVFGMITRFEETNCNPR